MTNITIARTLLEGLSGKSSPGAVTALMAEDVVFEIQGEDGALPWIGHQTGSQAITGMIRDQAELLDPLSLEIEDILASEARAVIVGSLSSRIKATGKVTAGQFAIVLTITDGVITRFQMLEDSFDVANAAR